MNPERLNGPGENGISLPEWLQRPDRNPSVSLSTASYSRARDYLPEDTASAQMFNPTSFTMTPSQYVIGNAQRNYGGMRNAPLAMENLNAKKNFYIGERWKAILSVDYFNAFNRTQFNGPDNNISDSTFGQVTSQGTPEHIRQSTGPSQLPIRILIRCHCLLLAVRVRLLTCRIALAIRLSFRSECCADRPRAP